MKPALLVLAASAFLLTGCFDDTKQDILAKAENVSDKTQLMEALGKPDEVDKLGPIESWTYKASNGEVTFVITGSAVVLKSTSDREKKN